MLGLPPEAMLWRGVEGWGTSEELAAMNVEATHSVMRVLLSAYGRKGSSVPKPLRIPRPRSDRERRVRARRRSATLADIERLGGSVVRTGGSPDGR